MKICPKCGAQAQNDARFCKGCAYNFSASDVDATVPIAQARRQAPGCPNCGSPVIPGAKICTNCAAPLAGGTMVEADFNRGGGFGGGYGAQGYAGAYGRQTAFGGKNRNAIIIGSIVGGVVLIGLIILIIVLATGGSSRSSVVKDAIKAVENNDGSTLYDLAARNTITRDGAKQFAELYSNAIKQRKGVKSVNIKMDEVDKNDPKRGMVQYELEFGDGGDKDGGIATLTQEDGKWKIVTLGTPIW